MNRDTKSLFPELDKDRQMSPSEISTGVLPSQEIEKLIERGSISALIPISPDQIQPASIDLRLGSVAYRVRASFLPGKNSLVSGKIEELGMHEIDLRRLPPWKKAASTLSR